MRDTSVAKVGLARWPKDRRVASATAATASGLAVKSRPGSGSGFSVCSFPVPPAIASSAATARLSGANAPGSNSANYTPSTVEDCGSLEVQRYVKARAATLCAIDKAKVGYLLPEPWWFSTLAHTLFLYHSKPTR